MKSLLNIVIYCESLLNNFFSDEERSPFVQKYFNIQDDSGQVSSRKVPFSRDFQKTVSYIKDNPFLQLIEI